MAKSVMSANDAFNYRQTLHVATLEALTTSRRWKPKDLIFQGGTSLHLAHGSPRFSEDLDFMVDENLNLNSIANSVKSRLIVSSAFPPDLELKISKIRTNKNPLSFVVNLGRSDMMGSVHVKVEMWRTPSRALQEINAFVAPVRIVNGPAAGMSAQVVSSGLEEIYADKVFAVAARTHLKARDIFDLYWIRRQGCAADLTQENLQTRLEIYPEADPEEWLENARERFDNMHTDASAIHKDLKRWLPHYWPLNEQTVGDMIVESKLALEEGMEIMQKIAHERRHELGQEHEAYPDTGYEP